MDHVCILKLLLGKLPLGATTLSYVRLPSTFLSSFSIHALDRRQSHLGQARGLVRVEI
jgi:hypothetical protein